MLSNLAVQDEKIKTQLVAFFDEHKHSHRHKYHFHPPPPPPASFTMSGGVSASASSNGLAFVNVRQGLNGRIFVNIVNHYADSKRFHSKVVLSTSFDSSHVSIIDKGFVSVPGASMVSRGMIVSVSKTAASPSFRPQNVSRVLNNLLVPKTYSGPRTASAMSAKVVDVKMQTRQKVRGTLTTARGLSKNKLNNSKF